MIPVGPLAPKSVFVTKSSYFLLYAASTVHCGNIDLSLRKLSTKSNFQFCVSLSSIDTSAGIGRIQLPAKTAASRYNRDVICSHLTSSHICLCGLHCNSMLGKGEKSKIVDKNVDPDGGNSIIL